MDDDAIDEDLTVLDEEEIFEEEVEDDPEFDPYGAYSRVELEEWANQLLLEDVNRELCPECKTINRANPRKQPNDLPYGALTGHVEAVAQYDKGGEAIIDDNEDQLYLDFPEFVCDLGHKWYKGEGPRRDIKGPNPILFKSHLDNRTRREIQNDAGVADPAFTKGRFGQPGMYNRVNPDGGRKQNTIEQRKRNGASFFGSSSPAEAWGWRLERRDQDGNALPAAPVLTIMVDPEKLAELQQQGKNVLHGEDKRDRRELMMPK